MPVAARETEFAAGTTTNVIHLKFPGKLTKEGDDTFVLKLEEWVLCQGKIRILFEMVDFHGWTVAAGWEDARLASKHDFHVEGIALFGNSTWKHGIAIFCMPFTAATVQSCEHRKRDEAIDWVVGGSNRHDGSS